MKKLLLTIVLAGVIPASMLAQDDLYFSPKKKAETKKLHERLEAERQVYYVGSDRDVDEYNRRHLRSYYQPVSVDSLGNDVIDFSVGDGEYPKVDTVFVDGGWNDEDDYRYSRRMSRFDGFYGYHDPFYYDYWSLGDPYWRTRWGWSYYDPWYSFAWEPGWYSGWYYFPWHHYGWYGGPISPYWGGGHHYWDGYAFHGGIPGSSNHGVTAGQRRTYAGGNFNGRRGKTSAAATSRRSTSARQGMRPFGSGYSNDSKNSSRHDSNSNSNHNFGGSRSSSSSGGFSGGGSRSGGGAGMRSGSFGGGGGRSGGGFGGRR